MLHKFFKTLHFSLGTGPSIGKGVGECGILVALMRGLVLAAAFGTGCGRIDYTRLEAGGPTQDGGGRGNAEIPDLAGRDVQADVGARVDVPASGPTDLGLGSPVDAPGPMLNSYDSAVPDVGNDAATVIANGKACLAAAACASGFCVDGLCCDSACGGLCSACNLPGRLGACVPVAAGADPQDECAVTPTTTCGRDGTCDGAGACRLHLATVQCGPSRCVASSSQQTPTCDGKGACQTSGPLYSCGTNLCTAGACPVLCPAGTCPQKYRCETGACVPDGLLLYWNLDETSPTATIANDSSGHGYHGTFTGAAGFPVASADVAPGLQFFNPSSRAFTMADRHAIQLAPMPPAIKRVNDITVSAFYRGTAPDSGGQSAVISLGDSIGLHVGPQQINLFKHVAGPEFVNLFVVGSPILDGQWHHVAGVVGTGGMRLFFDGQKQSSNLDGRPVIYIRGTDLWVGRHGSDLLDVDFGGNIDDVRIFDRALSDQEIADLSRGSHAP